jgi:hypothetical protein
MTINMRTTIGKIVSNYKHKRCKETTNKIIIMTNRMIISNYNQKGGKGWRRSTWGPSTRKVMSSCKRCKHKRCKTWTIKIKIMMTMRVTNNWSQKGRKGRQRSTWGLQPRGSWTTASTRDVGWPPPRPRLVVAII